VQQQPLQGRTILVTRPAHQAAALTALIEAAGGEVLPFPTIEIGPARNLEAAQQQFQQLEQFEILLFISANAARIGLELIRQQRELPANIQVAAVGQATTRTLNQAGVEVDILPQHRFDSEGLLATPQLQAVAGKRILIVRGEGGRELLATTLRQRGAEVEYAEAYRRTLPQSDPTPLLQAWQQQRLDAAVVTSNQSLDNLLQLVGDAGHAPLLQTPLVVISERTREVALERGFHHRPTLASTPSDDAILATLVSLFETTSYRSPNC
jgi:uroporphyrinogen-III synthase